MATQTPEIYSFEIPPRPDRPVDGETGLAFGDYADDRFRIVRSLPSNSVTEVFEATDRVQADPVAIKFFREPSPVVSQHVDFELRAHAAVSGETGIVPLRTMGVAETAAGLQRYMVTRLAPRGSLQDVTRHRGGDLDLALSVGQRITPGLLAAHQRNVAHRDIKPNNILVVDSDEFELTDFGVAEPIKNRGRAGSGPVELDMMLPDLADFETMPDYRDPSDLKQFVGTLGYAAPETIMDAPETPQVDVFGLMATLYKVATGKLPFKHEAGMPVDTYLHIIEEGPVPAHVLNGSIPLSFDQLTKEGLSPDPAVRPSLGAVIVRLEAIRQEIAAQADQQDLVLA